MVDIFAREGVGVLRSEVRQLYKKVCCNLKTKTSETFESVTASSITLSNIPSFIYGLYVDGLFTANYSVSENIITISLTDKNVTVVYEY